MCLVRNNLETLCFCKAGPRLFIHCTAAGKEGLNVLAGLAACKQNLIRGLLLALDVGLMADCLEA